MDLLIKNWKMPENCYQCPMMKNHLFHDGRKWQTGCFIEKASNITFVEKRPSWCPLVEVPPHGRLIDATELEASDAIIVGEDAWNMVHNAPTILEAST